MIRVALYDFEVGIFLNDTPRVDKEVRFFSENGMIFRKITNWIFGKTNEGSARNDTLYIQFHRLVFG